MTESTCPRWRIFVATNRLHYLRPDGASVGFVEQHASVLSGAWEFYATYNEGSGVYDMFVNDLQAGMTLIEWLHNEKKEKP
jgi:hypothetical protein